MAGVKGRSGGARQNTGGPRPGAGRPRKTPILLDHPSLQSDDPLEWLHNLMTLEEAETRLRLHAAKELLKYLTKTIKQPSEATS